MECSASADVNSCNVSFVKKTAAFGVIMLKTWVMRAIKSAVCKCSNVSTRSTTFCNKFFSGNLYMRRLGKCGKVRYINGHIRRIITCSLATY